VGQGELNVAYPPIKALKLKVFPQIALANSFVTRHFIGQAMGDYLTAG
jgi:hypothetical protein